MIAEGQKLMFKNVVSKIYNFHESEISEVLQQFTEEIEANDLHPNGPFFYSINSDLTKKEVLAEFFVPVMENYKEFSDEYLEFQTYFFVDQMIMTRLEGDFEEEVGTKIVELIEYAHNNKMETTSPVFFKINQFEEQTFLEIYLGATRMPETVQEAMGMIFGEEKSK
ncbi:DUF5085 domain-containing protein [Carnobacterium maltaromaticum]|uniref:DUF5085 family protein n=1 Tax=Carnobacterium maltaromaticum TaxID=2751 RepID=UPI000704A6AC|nr:DUF5085 family protein [Carnobacterium maltaromaticum]KRN87410.1 hypothetical protein IV75_GL002113 [Carnobacterium maltaromaticum]MDT1945046.1 DUF5085 family protein [Carnobacterium maltaromaticum]MDT1998695.1 DUF5085 family protein [Carnobacterium maltaromaticum]TFJ27905.1 DUF5085 domain-containing protein [Carnobacterium maltaromaticum]TFJ31588.1 DUF5085 domain-containing protein [Carnobacterium maltaromaticum]